MEFGDIITFFIFDCHLTYDNSDEDAKTTLKLDIMQSVGLITKLNLYQSINMHTKTSLKCDDISHSLITLNLKVNIIL